MSRFQSMAVECKKATGSGFLIQGAGGMFEKPGFLQIAPHDPK